MGKMFKSICMAAALTVGPVAAHAAYINVGGVVWDPDEPTWDFSSNTNLVEVAASQTGEVIDGYGIANLLNGDSSSSFCPSCELTYVFGGYTLVDLNPTDPTTGISPTGGFAFTGGWLKVYVDHTPDYDSDVKASAEDGTLWLDLLAVDINGDNTGITLGGQLTLPVAQGIGGTGFGYFDVIGGLAMGNLDTNEQAGGRDLAYTSSFQPFPNGNTTPEGYTHYGTGDLSGSSIPEPSTIAIFGISLLGLGLVRRRKKA
ncbi:MAG: PEP-CTERM sorting domain-containing protein [Sedimenticola sp.]